MRRHLTAGPAHALLVAALLLPLALLAWRALNDRLGGNPIEFITHATGDWTLRLLLLTLAVTPLRRILAWPELIRFRRTLGLAAFFYGCLHLLTYVWLDQFFDIRAMLRDVAKRPFITAGVTAFCVMLPLALTSTAAAIRRIGGRNWRRLHRLVYFAALAGVVHYYWLVKSDVRRPLLYAALLAALLLIRIPARRIQSSSSADIGPFRSASAAAENSSELRGPARQTSTSGRLNTNR
jgi:sulfoxide reductase heme-binding subunit YedZ